MILNPVDRENPSSQFACDAGNVRVEAFFESRVDTRQTIFGRKDDVRDERVVTVWHGLVGPVRKSRLRGYLGASAAHYAGSIPEARVPPG